VRPRGAGVVLGHRRAKGTRAREVSLREVRDDRKRVGFVRQEIGGQHAPARAAGFALRDGHSQGLGAVERDDLPLDATSRQLERLGTAAFAGKVRKQALRLAAVIPVDVCEKVLKLDG